MRLGSEKVTHEDFRLRADSPGYQAGEDGKDLGADIDFVGPGKAYERWKKTPEYQEWLKETGQLMDRSAAIAQPAAFVLLGGEGVADRKFDTLAEAVQRASDGDTIEIRGNGPFVTDGVTIQQALVIRAGTGFHPVIKLSKSAGEANRVVMDVLAPLVLEGLDLRRSEPAVWQADSSLYPVLVQARGNRDIAMANCRLMIEARDGSCAAIAADGPAVRIQNCLFLANGGSMGWLFPAGGSFYVRNCISAVGQIALRPKGSGDTKFAMEFQGNTLVGNILNLTIDSEWDSDELIPDDPNFDFHFLHNIVQPGTQGVLFFHQYGLGNPLSLDDVESALPRLVRFREERNIYHAPAADLLLVAVDWQTQVSTCGANLDEWQRFWGLSDTQSSAGSIRFTGGNLLERSLIHLDELTPEDFRLRPDSAGYRAGPDGKDLGADIHLVGPGEAYERWKQTPEYQHWLKKTGQSEVDADVTVGDAQPAPAEAP
jgi:hypothetical protein